MSSCILGTRDYRAWLGWALLIAPFLWLWFTLFDNLKVEWSTNPTYSYGWIVPFLCLGLLTRHWDVLSEPTNQEADFSPWLWGVFALFALFYLPIRLVAAATPEWRLVQWSLGVVAIGLTLCAIYAAKGSQWLRLTAFPIAFFLVAIPWPSMVEGPIIQYLTQANSSMVVEIMGIMGIPALQHGNVIEVGTGVVGIDEACSGIRSFQSSLMISLFLGGYFGLGIWRRLILVPIGFLVAFGFNVCRTGILTWLAANKGVDSISEYHDQAGLAILLACTATMWLTACLIHRREQKAEDSGQKAKVGSPKSEITELPSEGRPLSSDNLAPHSAPPIFRLLAFGLLAWMLLVELGVGAWYKAREARIDPGPNWTLVFPTNKPSFKNLTMSAKTENLLRFDQGKQGGWQEEDGSEWRAFYFEWFPGRVAGYLAKRHTPDACLPAAGFSLASGPTVEVLNIQGVELPIRAYVFRAANTTFYVYHCRWEAGATRQAYTTEESASFNLIRGIWAGRGKHGQKVLEVIATGYDDATQAKTALILQLERMIKVEKRNHQGSES